MRRISTGLERILLHLGKYLASRDCPNILSMSDGYFDAQELSPSAPNFCRMAGTKTRGVVRAIFCNLKTSRKKPEPGSPFYRYI